MGIARMLGSFVAETAYEDLPASVVATMKGRILDFLGTAFDSYARHPMTAVIRVLQGYGAKQEATVIGAGVRLPCGWAAMVNSAYHNQGDGSRFAGVHPSCVVIPAALAAAETRGGVSGKELILASVLGSEVILRLGAAMYPSTHNRGFSPTTVQGPIGAAAAVAKILRLEGVAIADALSLSALMGHGLQAADRAPYPAFSFQTGRASEAGVLCALAVQAGLKGSDEILEEGFIPAFSDSYRPEDVGRDLGRTYALEQTYIKYHYGCRHMHGPIDAALQIRNAHHLNWQEIDQIKVKTYSTALAVCNIHHPQNGRQAEYTIEFGVPLALVYGYSRADRFCDAVLNEAPIRELMGRITVEVDPELDRLFPGLRASVVEITTKGGRRLVHRQDYAKGEPENPVSSQELEAKFQGLASGTLSEQRRTQIVALLNRLESVGDTAGLFPLLQSDHP